MKYIKGTLLILLGAGLALAAVLAVSMYREDFPRSFYTVEVINNSNSPITQVRIEDRYGLVSYKNMEIVDRISVPIHIRSESSYKIFVRLENGKAFNGGVGYVERGYSTKEVVTNSGIRSGSDGSY